jgi:hypothetical protein
MENILLTPKFGDTTIPTPVLSGSGVRVLVSNNKTNLSLGAPLGSYMFIMSAMRSLTILITSASASARVNSKKYWLNLS